MKISIITATYNSAKTVRDTFESVSKQTYKEIEYIVVDGASKDETVSIIKEYEPKFEGRMRWISEPDKGLYDAMNKGIAMATGDVVGILNSDDFYTSDDVLERIANEMQQDDVDAVYSDIHFVNDSDLTKCVRYYSSKGFRLWKMRLGFIPAHPSFYCKREVYEKYGTFDLDFKLAADFENLLRLLFIHRIKTRYIPMDSVTMRTGGASTSGVQSYKQGMQDHLKAYKKNGVYSNVIFEGIRYIWKGTDLICQKIVNIFRE